VEKSHDSENAIGSEVRAALAVDWHLHTAGNTISKRFEKLNESDRLPVATHDASF